MYETRLSAVQLNCPAVDALPDGGFVLADSRSTIDQQHVQVFDALGRSSWTFRTGDAIAHLIADEAGDLWVGYFDEGCTARIPSATRDCAAGAAPANHSGRSAPAPGSSTCRTAGR